MTEEEKLKDKRQTRTVFILVCIGFVGFITYLINSSGSSSNNVNQAKQEIHCLVCGEDLTNTYQRIAPNGDNYYCMPCYNKTMNGIHNDMRSEGYDTDEYSGRQSSSVQGFGRSNDDDSEISSGYSTGSDGRIYENKACGLCGGTGIEEVHNSLGTTSRTCPMCGGKGHQNY